jgi:hypothetical protein
MKHNARFSVVSSRWRIGRFVFVITGLLFVWACTERNPDFDPESYCETGQRRCGAADTIVICNADHQWPDPAETSQWVIDCWQETMCSETAGACVPDDGAVERPCARFSDCGTDRICAALVSPDEPADLAGYCITPPHADGREGGQACNTSSQCKSGRCTRNVCFRICQETADCTQEGHVCEALDLTVDGRKYWGKVKGCVPPS